VTVDVALLRPWAPSAVPEGSLVEDALGVGYLASSLRAAGRSVAVVDAYTFGLGDEELAQCAAALDPRVIGVSLHSFADYRHTINVATRLKALRPDAYCVVGGEHATFLAREVLERHPCIDAVVMGEGEVTVVELVDAVLGGNGLPQVLGAMTRDAGGTVVDPGYRKAIEDLDCVPRPAKDIVEIAIQAGKPVALSLLTGRGCTHKCTFCTANTYLRMGSGVVWRRRTPSAVADEFEDLVSRFGGRPGVHPMVQFQDVIFLGTSPQAKRWVDGFVTELEHRNLQVPYYIMSRAEAILANADLLPRLAASGLASVEIGIESGVDRILQLYNKRNSADRNFAAIRLLQQHGICYDASGFIMFDPRITPAELRINAGYLHDLGHATWDRYVTKLQIFPGTAIRPELIASGLFDRSADLGDVYAYRFLDRETEEVARHVWMYDEGVRDLDNAIHHARALAVATGAPEPFRSQLRGTLGSAQRLYRDFFLSIVDLATAGRLAESFGQRLTAFLAQAELARRALVALLCDTAGLMDPSKFMPIPAPAPESEVVPA
jgi:hypothetical protein